MSAAAPLPGDSGVILSFIFEGKPLPEIVAHLTQLGLLPNSKSTLFCVGDQAESVGIRGRRE